MSRPPWPRETTRGMVACGDHQGEYLGARCPHNGQGLPEGGLRGLIYALEGYRRTPDAFDHFTRRVVAPGWWVNSYYARQTIYTWWSRGLLWYVRASGRLSCIRLTPEAAQLPEVLEALWAGSTPA